MKARTMQTRFVRTALAVLSAAVLAATPFVAGAADTITLNVRDANLTDVLLLIARQGHFNLVPDQALSSGSGGQRIAALSLTGVTPRVALTAIEQAYGLKEIADAGYIRIVPSTSAEFANSGTTVRVDVAGQNAQTFVQGLQQALPGVVVIAPQGAKAIVLSGPPDQVARGRGLILAALGIDGSSPPALDTPIMIGVSHSLPSDLLKQLVSSGYADSPLIVVADDSHNRLIAKGPTVQLKRLTDAVVLLDTPVPLVTFDVQVLDVQPINDSSNIGVQWGGTQSGSGSTNATVSVGSTITAFANRYIPIAAQLNALLSNGTAQALARPSVVVANGKTGKVLVGEQYPIAITNGSLVGGSNVNFVPIGVQLEISPVIGANGTIGVKLKTTYSDLLGKDPVSQYPIIGDRSVESELTVNDGEPIIIAGLFQDLSSDTIAKVPLLGSVPILGEFFKNRQKSHTRDEIVFALYPHIGSPKTAAPEVSDAAH
jgi:type II secretory pathway component GspD/PulD (secretin)